MQVVSKYRKIIEDVFFPTRGFGQARLAVSKKAISEYKSVIGYWSLVIGSTNNQ
jgi:hypothetical protein